MSAESPQPTNYRLAVVAGSYLPQRDGVSVYIENLLAQLLREAARVPGGVCIEVFGCEPGMRVLQDMLAAPDAESGVTLNFHSVEGQGAWAKFVALPWRVFRRGRFDLTVLPNLQPLLLRGRRLSILHDLTYQVAREHFPRLRFTYMHWLTRWRLAADDAMAVISQTTGMHLSRYYSRSHKLPRPLLPNGLPLSKLGPRPDRQTREAAITAPELELLFCGRLNTLKGVDRLLDVARELDQDCARGNLPPTCLHIVGKATAETDALFAGQRFQHLRLRRYGFLEDEELNDLYRRAAFAFFLSRNEGFGLPLIEALWMGAVPLLSDIHIFAEIMGAAYPRFVNNPTGTAALLDFIRRVRGDAGYRARMLQHCENALKAHEDGYQRSARGVLEFMQAAPQRQPLMRRLRA